mmetsp:Transcript_9427/g.15253  ORF Transcript_9427/g.15253 Transcript_9427/m.15253 type:complete len:116 (-) Transcript_9427:64-411(-)
MYREECRLRCFLMITRSVKRRIIKMESDLLACMRRIETITACEAQRSNDKKGEAVVKRRRGRPRKNQERSANKSTPVLTRKRRPPVKNKKQTPESTRRSKRLKRPPETCGAYLRK